MYPITSRVTYSTKAPDVVADVTRAPERRKCRSKLESMEAERPRVEVQSPTSIYSDGASPHYRMGSDSVDFAGEELVAATSIIYLIPIQIVSMQALHYITLSCIIPPLLALLADQGSLNYEGGSTSIGV
jgi:hypothetical protein